MTRDPRYWQIKRCGVTWVTPYSGTGGIQHSCNLEAGHDGAHESADGDRKD